MSFEDFKKLELRTARVLEAVRIPETSKLLKLKLDLGGEERQIVSGIAEDYSPEDLVGSDIVIVANLEPRVLKGVESQGMLLAASADGIISLLRPDKKVPPGSQVH